MYHLPSYYDILHTPGTAEDIDLYVRIARRFDLDPRRWLEPGCGTGRHLRVLAARGYVACGYDIDAEMVKYARRSLRARGLNARLFESGMSEFHGRLPKCKFDIAINPHSTIRHLHREKELLTHLEQMAKSLSPRGLYLVGISLARYTVDRPESDLWLAARGRLHVRQTITYTPPSRGKRVEDVHSSLVVTRPTRVETHHDSYRLRTYDRRQWERVLSRSPFTRLASLDEDGLHARRDDLPYQIDVLSIRQ